MRGDREKEKAKKKKKRKKKSQATVFPKLNYELFGNFP